MIRVLINQQKSGRKRAIWFFWSWVMPVFILAVITMKLTDDATNFQLIQSVQVVHITGIVCCVFLLSLNVGFEAWKWQYILRPVVDESIIKCIRIILSGKSLNVISPFGIGDGFSRYAALSSENKGQVFAGLAIDRLSQMIPTIVFGLAAVFYLLEYGLEVPIDSLLGGLCFFGGLGLVGAFLLFLLRKKVEDYLALIRVLDWNKALKLLVLSFGRYLIFFLQFYLVFWALGNQLSLTTTLFGIAWIFFVKTIIPDLSVLGDLVKREVSATLFFSFFIPDISVVLVAGFLVWVINILLPALLGLLFVSDLKRSL